MGPLIACTIGFSQLASMFIQPVSLYHIHQARNCGVAPVKPYSDINYLRSMLRGVKGLRDRTELEFSSPSASLHHTHQGPLPL